ncbi:hypothetical protein CDD81_4199 [Ophiocordyceps australis]|uniref:Uncharacterized protein n=1 Tax=Ophiocordyceps australis TaxID=1399860 RepID=A0A2C5XJ76_9HYPO|nr:hypothetical protein CDD81_4199 [Ophiocordyceps australis]
MSSREQPRAKDAKDKRSKALAKVLSKVKTVLKRGEGSSRAPGPSKTKGESASHQSKPSPSSKPAEARARYEGLQGVTKLTRSQLFEERAKKLAERYGIDIKPSDWPCPTLDDTVLRVNKPIRIRVRRTCHRCASTFSAAKLCPNCDHSRCKKCPRYPPKRTEAEKLASRERMEIFLKANRDNPPMVADYAYYDHGIVLKRPSKTGGQDLYYKKPRQRVRRSCHECYTIFKVGSKECHQCGHLRCTDCPRDPPKKDKYPFGYPGDVFGPNSVARYACERCETIYPPDATYHTMCKRCGCEMSDASPRVMPRKMDPEPDPEILKAIQAKLELLKLS